MLVTRMKSWASLLFFGIAVIILFGSDSTHAEVSGEEDGTIIEISMESGVSTGTSSGETEMLHPAGYGKGKGASLMQGAFIGIGGPEEYFETAERMFFVFLAILLTYSFLLALAGMNRNTPGIVAKNICFWTAVAGATVSVIVLIQLKIVLRQNFFEPSTIEAFRIYGPYGALIFLFLAVILLFVRRNAKKYEYD